jgi:tetratricopeptide (TPR) repeat protein
MLLGSSATAPAATGWTPAQQAALLSIQQDWAKVNYEVAGEDRKGAGFEALAQRAQSLVAANPGRAEPLIWQGIVLSTWAGVKGGLGALSLAKQARDALESALKIDPSALEGSAYTSLGTLYYKVPGFPIGFGDHKKARQLLEAALKVNPDGIDSNYYYGEYLFDEDRYADAMVYLNRALAAAPRPNREIADRGRRVEIESLLGKARAKAG